MIDNDRLDKLILSERDRLKKLEAKQDDINKKIKNCKTNIEKYTLMKNNKQFNRLSNVLDEKGIAFEDILSAITSGNISLLQDKLEVKN